MTDLITAEEAEKLLDGTTPGPWLREAQGIYADNGHKLVASVKSHEHGIAWPTTEANGNIMAAAPNLARTVIALHAQLADAQAAMATVVERAASTGYRVCAETRHITLGQKVEAAIRALAHIDGLALVRELRDRAEKAETLRDEAVEKYAAGVDKRLADQTRAESAEAERDRLAAANAALEAKVAGLVEAVDEQTKARAQHWLRRTMTAPEDAEVEALCERCGYGAVMDAASRLWARKPHGSGAFYIGGCIGFKSDEEARAALATLEAGNG